MGEDKKEEAKKEEKKEDIKEEKKEEGKKEEQEIVLKVDMHCEACARKVSRALKGFEGVEEVAADYKASKVVVKGKAADPIKVCQRVQKKSGRKVELVSPLPNPIQQDKQPEKKEEKPNKDEKKEEPPAVVTVVLKVRMHCEACAQALQKRLGKFKGVESVITDAANDHVTVKGAIDPHKLVTDIYKKTGKQAAIIVVKEEEKKEEENEEEKQEEKKQAEESKEEDDKQTEVKRMEYLPPPNKYYMEHAYYAPQMFSDENPNACYVM